MLLTRAEAAAALGISPQAAGGLVAGGQLTPLSTVGNQHLVDDVAVRALSRANRHGRVWSGRTLEAALGLLDSGTTEAMGGSELSRLRSRLRAMNAPTFAHMASGRGRLVRLSPALGTTQEVSRSLLLSGASALSDHQLEHLDLTPTTSGLVVGYAGAAVMDDLDVRFGLSLDPNGQLLIRVTDQPQRVTDALVALDLFELGDARESMAARGWLEAMLSAV